MLQVLLPFARKGYNIGEGGMEKYICFQARFMVSRPELSQNSVSEGQTNRFLGARILIFFFNPDFLYFLFMFT